MIIYIIKFMHLLLFLILLLSIFISNNLYKLLSLIILIFLLLQFIINEGKCCLTELEYIIKKEKYKEGFLYRLINPIIKRNENYFDNYYYLFHITWIIILLYQLLY